jgi:hypothetical protein
MDFFGNEDSPQKSTETEQKIAENNPETNVRSKARKIPKQLARKGKNADQQSNVVVTKEEQDFFADFLDEGAQSKPAEVPAKSRSDKTDIMNNYFGEKSKENSGKPGNGFGEPQAQDFDIFGDSAQAHHQ